MEQVNIQNEYVIFEHRARRGRRVPAVNTLQQKAACMCPMHQPSMPAWQSVHQLPPLAQRTNRQSRRELTTW
jgi:hypothetical protein